jgi:hypothetical protein
MESGVPFDIRRFDLNANPDLKAKLTGPLRDTRKGIPRSKPREWFFHSRIPGSWLAAVIRLRPGTLRVALAIWHHASLSKSATVSLSAKSLALFSITHVERGIADLEKAGLISVNRQRGRRPQITIREGRP